MTRSLRQRQRALITVLTVLLALLFIAALLARRPAPVSPRLPEALQQNAGGAQR
jgi:hypothetical protein